MRRLTPSRRWLRPAFVAGSVAVLVGAGAAAAFESDTVGSYGRGVLWAISLMTTVGFLGQPPRTTEGAVLSVGLMLAGFLLLSLVSAALASLFVKQDEAPEQRREAVVEDEILRSLGSILERLEALENRLAPQDEDCERGEE
jgi:voltage-gated potassium channel